MFFYFSGTGNSRFVAERVARSIDQEAIDVTTYTKDKKTPAFTDEGVYVFVCPSYMSAPARSMTEFIESATFPKGARAFFIVTCAVSMGISPRVCSELCEKKGLEYVGAAQVVMPQNYIALFKMQSTEENKKIVKDALPSIDKIADMIKNGEKTDDKVIKSFEYALTKWVRDVYYKGFMKTKKFKATDACISCGKCAKVCPLSNISMNGNKPSWGKNCTHCMACINQCPKEAIEYGKGSVGKTRYKGPESCLG
ncbi:MAG: EFR1 family ferrodoxin [Clostridia bacterium]|nr:EFR1 family ferrodoxin [Clostridia bacterium]